MNTAYLFMTKNHINLEVEEKLVQFFDLASAS